MHVFSSQYAEMKCPSSCQSPVSQRHPGSHLFSPRRSSPFSSLLLYCSSSLSFSACPVPLAIASSYSSPKTKFFRRQYLHILSPPSHFPFTPNPLPLASATTALVLLPRATVPPLRQIHGIPAYLRPTQLFTAFGTVDHFLILKPSSLADTIDAWFSSYTAGYSFPVSFSDSSSFVRYPDGVFQGSQLFSLPFLPK